jgi:hypothetical protein
MRPPIVSLGLYGGNRTQGYGGQLNIFQGKEKTRQLKKRALNEG